ncbi:MAG: hypothetical protein RL172_394 [Bacteroidota bacterium]|jgi:uncharacterized protein (TIGR03067 family)
MKRLLFLLLLLPTITMAQEQDLQKENIALKRRIDTLETRLDDKYYTRVPNKDFDKQLTEMVDKQVGSYFSGKIAFISSLVGLISLLVGYLFRYYQGESTRKQIEISVKDAGDKMRTENSDAQKNLNLQLDTQKTFLADNNKLYNDRLSDISTRIDNIRTALNNQLQQYSSTVDKRIGDFEANIKTQITQLNDQYNTYATDTRSKLEKFETAQQEFVKINTEMLDKKMTETLDFLWGDVIGAMIDRAADRHYEGADLINSFEKLLGTNLKINTDLKIQVIDTLMRCYYHTPKLDKKYDRMVSLIQTYDDKYELLPQTYVNAAIALTNNYELYGSADLKETAISNCDKSIKRERGYGIPYAIKVEIYLIDLLKARQQADKDTYTKMVDDQLYLVDGIDSPLLKGEFLQRLMLDKAVPFLQKYITALYTSFAKQLMPIRENVVFELVRNYAKATEAEKKMLTGLLQEGLDANSNIDGSWQAVAYEAAGETIALQDTLKLELKLSDYSFITKDAVIEKGLIYYLPGILQPAAVLLVCEQGANKDKITRGIYQQLPGGELQICIGKVSGDRPATFTSGSADGYSLITFNKV